MNPWLLASLFVALPVLAAAGVGRSDARAQHVKLLLAFSGAFLLTVTVVHMLPELYADNPASIGGWVMAGFMLQVVLEFFSHGIEHGHAHVHKQAGHTLPFTTMLSLCVHSFTEGMPFADPAVRANLSFVAGVLMHKAPMAIALATVLRRSEVAPAKAWTMIIVFALALPLGVGAGIVGGDHIGGAFLSQALALAIGMLLHISTTIIFESTPDHHFNAKRFITVLIGAGLAFITLH